MTSIDRRFEFLEAIAQLMRLSAGREYDHLFVKVEMKTKYIGTSSCKIVRGVVEPLYLWGCAVDDLNRELIKEVRKRTGRGAVVRYTLVVDKYGAATAAFNAFYPRGADYLRTDRARLLRQHNSKATTRRTSRGSRIWRWRMSKVPPWPLLPRNRLEREEVL